MGEVEADSDETRRSDGRSAAIRQSLEETILTGRLGDGARLDEQAIARQYGVSRTPVREAINQLASAGLVDRVPHRGAFVRGLGIGDLVEMFEVMAELEAMAGRLAARRRDDKALAILRERMDACERAAEAGDPDDYFAKNERFHQTIYAICGNGFLAREARRLHQRLRAHRRLQLHVPRRVGQSLAEHAEIVAAIAAGDEARAEDGLRRHIRVQGDRFADLVAAISASDVAKAGGR